MVGRPEAYQPSIHVDDAAAAIVAALDAPSGFYNVADQPITKGEWNAAFAEAFGIEKTNAPRRKWCSPRGAGRSPCSPAAVVSRPPASPRRPGGHRTTPMPTLG